MENFKVINVVFNATLKEEVDTSSSFNLQYIYDSIIINKVYGNDIAIKGAKLNGSFKGEIKAGSNRFRNQLTICFSKGLMYSVNLKLFKNGSVQITGCVDRNTVDEVLTILKTDIAALDSVPVDLTDLTYDDKECIFTSCEYPGIAFTDNNKDKRVYTVNVCKKIVYKLFDGEQEITLRPAKLEIDGVDYPIFEGTKKNDKFLFYLYNCYFDFIGTKTYKFFIKYKNFLTKRYTYSRVTDLHYEINHVCKRKSGDIFIELNGAPKIPCVSCIDKKVYKSGILHTAPGKPKLTVVDLHVSSSVILFSLPIDTGAKINLTNFIKTVKRNKKKYTYLTIRETTKNKLCLRFDECGIKIVVTISSSGQCLAFNMKTDEQRVSIVKKVMDLYLDIKLDVVSTLKTIDFPLEELSVLDIYKSL